MLTYACCLPEETLEPAYAESVEGRHLCGIIAIVMAPVTTAGSIYYGLPCFLLQRGGVGKFEVGASADGQQNDSKEGLEVEQRRHHWQLC